MAVQELVTVLYEEALHLKHFATLAHDACKIIMNPFVQRR